jgi:tRNA/tmRNA/rRNA uracil-C5-methylase (TrmA/RlmC/RlmD family)
VLSQGNGSLHGIDSSSAMIEASKTAASAKGFKNLTFEGKL